MPDTNPPPPVVLETPPSKRLAVRVTKDVIRQIHGGHPWVFDSSIASVKPDGAPGDLAVIFDHKRDFVAIGLYDPDSPIRVKIIHHGKPTPIDESFWAGRLQAALDLRAPFAASGQTTAYRCVHGENDAMPGFVLDRYNDTYVLKLYSASWFPHLNTIIGLLDEMLHPDALVLRLGRNAAHGETFGLVDGQALIGEAPTAPLVFRENDLRFEADVVHGQKTGFFLDQRDNRKEVRSRAVGRRVLDVFSSTGGFSVNAAAGGASVVHSVDISAPAIEAAQRNMALNLDRPQVKACQHEVTIGDAPAVLQEMVDRHRTFDMVIVDPPSFASRQAQVDGALDAYQRLTDLALRLLAPRGTLVQASCSSRVTADQFYDVVDDAAWRRNLRLAEAVHTKQPADHPVSFAQGAYLKAVFGRIEPR